jgi:hypothetical protein
MAAQGGTPRPGFCPGCGTAQLVNGREACQACAALGFIYARDAEAEAGQ